MAIVSDARERSPRRVSFDASSKHGSGSPTEARFKGDFRADSSSWGLVISNALSSVLFLVFTAVLIAVIIGVPSLLVLPMLEPDTRLLSLDQSLREKPIGLLPQLLKEKAEVADKGGFLGPPKVAFMFLVRGPMPLIPLWERFLARNMDRASVYVHASMPGFNISSHVSPASYFWGKQIPGVRVNWGGLSVVEAEKALFSAALTDPANQRFVLVSESCIPVRSFDFVYSYLLAGNRSFVTSHKTGYRYPGRKVAWIVPKSKFRKGSQWVALNRRHAFVVSKDRVVFNAFSESGAWIPDESYIQTLVPLVDPQGIESRSVSYLNWPSIFSRHPQTYKPEHVTGQLIRAIQGRSLPVEETINNFWGMSTSQPCQVNGESSPCFLFARKFHGEALGKLLSMDGVLGY